MLTEMRKPATQPTEELYFAFKMFLFVASDFKLFVFGI